MKNLGGESLRFIRKNFMPVKNKLLNKHSEAEEHFKKLLDDFGEYYVREKAWFKRNTEWSYYDFYIPYYRVYIEIDGNEHKENKTVMEKDRLKDKRRVQSAVMTAEKRKKGEDMLRWIEQRSMGN